MARDCDFDGVFLDHFDELVRTLTAITGDQELARDCVQEAFVRAYVRWNRIRRYESPVTWVRRVAINRSRDVHRSESRRRRREDRVVSDLVSRSGPPADHVESHLQLTGLLDELTPQQRAVAALYYLQDISVSETAASLGITTGAVKFHLHQARGALKVLLDGERVHDG